MITSKKVGIEVLKNIDYTKTTQSVFTTYEWVSFLEKSKFGKPIVLEIYNNNKLCAYFVALIFKKFGVKILASPFEGWTTPDMGFILLDYIDSILLINHIKEYAFKRLKCIFVEIVDKNIELNYLIENKLYFIHQRSLKIDLSIDEETIFKSFKKDARNFIRQFDKRGAYIEEVQPNIDFAKNFYKMLQDVFLKQKLTPPYDEKRVINLMESFINKKESILCLQVKNEDGIIIAASIYFGHNLISYSWGSSSLREYQHYRPNEAMRWYAIKYWKSKGYKIFDMVGVREYKYKFNPIEYEYPRIIIAKYKFLIKLRNLSKLLIIKIRKIKSKLNLKRKETDDQ